MAERVHPFSTGTIAIMPPAEQLHFQGEIELLSFTNLRDYQGSEVKVFETKNSPRNLYHSSFLTLEKVDEEHIRIFSDYLSFTVVLNLSAMNFQILERKDERI